MPSQFIVEIKLSNVSEQFVVEAESGEDAVKKAIELLLKNASIRVRPLILEHPNTSKNNPLKTTIH